MSATSSRVRRVSKGTRSGTILSNCIRCVCRGPALCEVASDDAVVKLEDKQMNVNAVPVHHIEELVTLLDKA